MAEQNVIRQDIVQILFDIQDSPLRELQQMIRQVTGSAAGLGRTEDTLQQLADSAGSAGIRMGTLAESAEDVNPAGVAGLGQELDQSKEVAAAATKELSGMAKETLSLKKAASPAMQMLKQLAGVPVSNLTQGLTNLKGRGLDAARDAGKHLLDTLNRIGTVSLKGAIAGLKEITKLSAKGIGKGAAALGSGLLRVGGAAVKGITAGITAAGTALAGAAAAAFSFGSEYETSLAKVRTLLDTSVMSTEELSGAVLTLSNETGESATELNEAVYQALSAGADADQVTDLVATAVKAAKGGFTDTATAIDGLTSAMNAYGMETGEAEGLANQFLITQNKGKTTFGELSSSIGGVAPTAKAAGVGMDELLSGVASLTANGIGTSEAMTGIKAALSNVIKPSGEAAKMAESLGLNFSTASLQSKGLVGFLDDVKKATKGDTDKMAKLFGSVEALNTVLTLTSDQGAALMLETLDEMKTNTTALDDAYETMTDTAQVSVQKGLNSFKNLGIGMYQRNEGIVSELTGLFASAGQDMYNAFSSGGMDGLVDQLGKTLTGLVTKITSYLPQMVESGTDLLESLIDGIAGNSETLAGCGSKALTAFLKGLIKLVPKLLLTGADLIGDFVEAMIQELPGLQETGKDGLKTLMDGIQERIPEMLTLGGQLLQELIDGIVEEFPALVTNGVAILDQLVQGIIQQLPLFLQQAPRIIQMLASTVATNFPTILTTGIQLLGTLVQGIINMLPSLIQTGLQLIPILVQSILSALPQLIVMGMQALISLVQGMITALPLIIQTGLQLIPMVIQALIENLPMLIEMGVQLLVTLAMGLIQGIPQLLMAIPDIILSLIKGLFSVNWLDVGIKIIKGIGSGLLNGIKGLFGFGKKAAKEVSDGAEAGLEETELSLNIDTTVNTSGTDSLMEGMKDLPGVTNEYYGMVTANTDTALTETNTVTKEQMAALHGSFATGYEDINNLTGRELDGMAALVDGVDLYASGQNIMNGLNDGLLSKQDTLNQTAAVIASGISGNLNQKLDIHSPSKVTFDTGKNVVLGAVEGIKANLNKVKDTALQVGSTLLLGTEPGDERYTPERTAGSSRTVSQVTNQYDANFNLTIQGGTDDRATERRVKKWIREGMDEYFARMNRIHPRVSEV